MHTDLPCRLVWRQTAALWGFKRAVSVVFCSFTLLGHCVEFSLEVLKWTKCGYKNTSEKQHVAFERSLKSLSLGRVHSFYFPAWCLSPGVNMQSACHFSVALCWNSSLGAALLFSFEFQPLWSKHKGRKFTCVLCTLFSHAALQWWVRCHQYTIHGRRKVKWLKTIYVSAKVHIPVPGFWIDDKALRMQKMPFPEILCCACRCGQREVLLFSTKAGIPSVMKCITAVKP